MAEIQSGHLNMPHQFHHHHHHEGFLQPTLVENENHQMDFKFPGISAFSFTDKILKDKKFKIFVLKKVSKILNLYFFF